MLSIRRSVNRRSRLRSRSSSIRFRTPSSISLSFLADLPSNALCQHSCNSLLPRPRAMDELVAKIVAATGVDASVARRAAALILGFLLREGASDKVGKLIDALPGAREAIA